jgi:hypothetical protein
MKEMFFGMVKFIVGLAIVILILIGACYLEKKHDEKIYNNGVCTECGGNYIFSGSAHVKNSDDIYYYTCDKCGHTIKVNRIMK